MSIGIIIVFFALANGQQVRPAIEGIIRNVTVSEFKDARFGCNIRVVPGYNSEVKWIKISSTNPLLISVGNFTTPTEGGRYKVNLTLNNNRGVSLLTIKNATRRDAGRYRCILRTQEIEYKKWPQKEAFLIINVLPRIYGGIRNTSVLENRTARINCEIQDMAASQSSVQWVRINKNAAPSVLSIGNNMMVTSGKYRTSMSTNGDMATSTLLVQNATKTDTGAYRCIVQTRGINSRDWSQSDGFLKVKGWPTIQGEITNQTAEEYDDSRLYCNVKDLTPNSKVRWAKIDKGIRIMISVGDNLRKNMVEKYKIELSTTNDWSISSLTVTSVSRKDAGRFRCIVETQGQPYREWPQKDGFLIVRQSRRWNANGRNDSTKNSWNFIVVFILILVSMVI